MKYTKQAFSVRIQGERYGQLWNNYNAWQEVSEAIGDNESLRDVVKRILSPDFQNALLTCDTVLIIALIKPNRRIVRYFDITLFSSISHLVGSEDFYTACQE